MTPHPGMAFLEPIERQLSEAAALLARGEATDLEAAMAALRDATVRWAQQLQAIDPAALAGTGVPARMRAVAHGLASLRQGLSRRAALVDQALRVLLPDAQRDTYGARAAVYGAAMARSGTFRVLTA